MNSVKNISQWRLREKGISFLESCKRHGCTLMTNAWTDQKGRSMMNLVLNSYSGTMFYDKEYFEGHP